MGSEWSGMHKYGKNEEGGKGSSAGESESLCGTLVHPKTFYKSGLKQAQLQNTYPDKREKAEKHAAQ